MLAAMMVGTTVAMTAAAIEEEKVFKNLCKEAHALGLEPPKRVIHAMPEPQKKVDKHTDWWLIGFAFLFGSFF